MNEDLSELARRNNKFRDEINSVIAIAAKLGWRGLIWTKLAVELEIWTAQQDEPNLVVVITPTWVKLRLALSPP